MKKVLFVLTILAALAAVHEVQACNGFAQKVVVRQQKFVQPVQQVVVKRQVVQQVVRPAKVVVRRQKVIAPVRQKVFFSRPAVRSFGRACAT